MFSVPPVFSRDSTATIFLLSTYPEKNSYALVSFFKRAFLSLSLSLFFSQKDLEGSSRRDFSRKVSPTELNEIRVFSTLPLPFSLSLSLAKRDTNFHYTARDLSLERPRDLSLPKSPRQAEWNSVRSREPPFLAVARTTSFWLTWHMADPGDERSSWASLSLSLSRVAIILFIPTHPIRLLARPPPAPSVRVFSERLRRCVCVRPRVCARARRLRLARRVRNGSATR